MSEKILMIDPNQPIELVNAEGKVLPARIVATDVKVGLSDGDWWLGLALEGGGEVPFEMNPARSYVFMVASGRMLTIRNRVDGGVA